jgi:hypothetical protein
VYNVCDVYDVVVFILNRDLCEAEECGDERRGKFWEMIETKGTSRRHVVPKKISGLWYRGWDVDGG